MRTQLKGLSMAVIALLGTVSLALAASYVTKSNYPISGYTGKAELRSFLGSGPIPPQTWYGNLHSWTSPAISIGYIGYNYYNLSTVCGSTATDYEGLSGNGKQPGDDYSRVSPVLTIGSCSSGTFYGYSTAKHNFQSNSGGAWYPITDVSISLPRN